LCIVVLSVILIKRIIDKDSIGQLLFTINDIIAIVFLLIYYNYNRKLGAALYIISFICYLIINIVFLPYRKLLTPTLFIRIAVVVYMSYSWIKNTMKKK
jgi:hypothetical protein